MKHVLSLILAPLLLAFAPNIVGAQGVPDDSWWGSGRDLVNIDVGVDPNHPGGVLVTATDDSGFSPAATGTEGSDSTAACTTCSSSKILTTPDGDQYLIGGHPSQVWKKNAKGKWVKMKKVKAPRKKANNMGGRASVSASSSSPGNNVIGLPE